MTCVWNSRLNVFSLQHQYHTKSDEFLEKVQNQMVHSLNDKVPFVNLLAAISQKTAKHWQTLKRKRWKVTVSAASYNKRTSAQRNFFFKLRMQRWKGKRQSVGECCILSLCISAADSVGEHFEQAGALRRGVLLLFHSLTDSRYLHTAWEDVVFFRLCMTSWIILTYTFCNTCNFTSGKRRRRIGNNLQTEFRQMFSKEFRSENKIPMMCFSPANAVFDGKHQIPVLALFQIVAEM